MRMKLLTLLVIASACAAQAHALPPAQAHRAATPRPAAAHPAAKAPAAPVPPAPEAFPTSGTVILDCEMSELSAAQLRNAGETRPVDHSTKKFTQTYTLDLDHKSLTRKVQLSEDLNWTAADNNTYAINEVNDKFVRFCENQNTKNENICGDITQEGEKARGFAHAGYSYYEIHSGDMRTFSASTLVFKNAPYNDFFTSSSELTGSCQVRKS